MLDPGVQFKAVERNALSTNRDFGEVGANLGVEAVTVHAEVAGGIAKAEKPRRDSVRSIRFGGHAHMGISDQDKSLSRLPVHARVRG